MACKVTIPSYEATAMDKIPQICKTARSTFLSNITKKLEWRKVQLRKLYWALEDFAPQIKAALKKDLNKGEYEATLSELDFVKNDCLYMLSKVDEFAKAEPADVPAAFAFTRIRKEKEPLGAALIIGAYNYPVVLLLGPLVGAIAAGCTAVLKPSEGAPSVAMVLRDMIEARLDPGAFAVVNGYVPETTALLEEKWDKIFYTGSTQVAKIIARKAAETLTPLTLELGGRNPVFVTRHANLKLAAKRSLWAKTLNAGQTCTSHNYILVERAVVEPFIAELKAAFKQFFPNGTRDSELAHIVNERQFLRMKKMLDESKGRIVMGGQMDQPTLFMEPTAVLVDSPDDAMVRQESFGPIFSILPFDTVSEAIEVANRVDPTPLALYAFGSKEENARVLNEVKSGGATINDSFWHASLPQVSFGGVGDSGTGSYRGKASFDSFTHERMTAEVPGWMEKFLRVRYMPYDWKELQTLNRINGRRPNFDRDGRVVRGLAYWAGLVLGLGGKGAKGALLRWGLVLAGWYYWTGALTSFVRSA